jgi:hypothetical protein
MTSYSFIIKIKMSKNIPFNQQSNTLYNYSKGKKENIFTFNYNKRRFTPLKRGK